MEPMGSDFNALEIRQLFKSFSSNFKTKKYPILKGIEISAGKSQIYGYLGINGAGKTTTIKCIMGLIFPDHGTILINGESSTSIITRRKLGFLPENPYFYDYLTAKEYLYLTGMLFSWSKKKTKDRTSELLKMIGLEGKEDTRLRKFSKGMIQRLGLAQALFNDPEIVILDEPFSGLDPIGRKELREIILLLKTQGKTIFFSSHILQDMELMADKVGIIQDGRITREGQLSDLVSHSVQYIEVICSGISPNLEAELRPVRRQLDHLIFHVQHEEEIDALLSKIISDKGRVVSVSPVKMTLEDIFIKQIKTKAPGSTS